MVSYNQREATVFPCHHELSEKVRSMGRCVVCRMPLEESGNAVIMFNTKAGFCCDECKQHYIKVMDELKALW